MTIPQIIGTIFLSLGILIGVIPLLILVVRFIFRFIVAMFEESLIHGFFVLGAVLFLVGAIILKVAGI